MCSIQFECCPSTTVTLGPIKNSLIILSLYLSTVFQSFRAGEKGYYVTASGNFDISSENYFFSSYMPLIFVMQGKCLYLRNFEACSCLRQEIYL